MEHNPSESEFYQKLGEFMGRCDARLENIERRQERHGEAMRELKADISGIKDDISNMKLKAATTGALSGGGVSGLIELAKRIFGL